MSLLRVSYILLMFILFGGLVLAQGSAVATQSLTLEVRPITKISVSGNPSALIINDAGAGMELTSVQDENTSYSVTSNLTDMKIVASISAQMPIGTNLMIQLRSSNGTSKGLIDVSNAVSPVDVVTGIGKGTDQNQSIAYVFAAQSNVGSIPMDSRVVTLTLTN